MRVLASRPAQTRIPSRRQPASGTPTSSSLEPGVPRGQAAPRQGGPGLDVPPHAGQVCCRSARPFAARVGFSGVFSICDSMLAAVATPGTAGCLCSGCGLCRSCLTVTVVCGECGSRYELSRRNKLEHERRGMPHRCPGCRHPHTEPTPAQVEAMKDWWVTTYGLDNVRSWPPI